MSGKVADCDTHICNGVSSTLEGITAIFSTAVTVELLNSSDESH